MTILLALLRIPSIRISLRTGMNWLCWLHLNLPCSIWPTVPKDTMPNQLKYAHLSLHYPPFDDTKLLSGYPSSYVVLARKSGDCWYIAGLNGTNEKKSLVVDLSFIQKPVKEITFVCRWKKNVISLIYRCSLA